MAQTKTYCNCKDVLNRLKQPRLDELYHKLFDEIGGIIYCYVLLLVAKSYDYD